MGFYLLQFQIVCYQVHGVHSGGSNFQLSPVSHSTVTRSPNSNITRASGSASITEFQTPDQSICSPGSVEVSSAVVFKNDRTDHLNIIESTGKDDNSSGFEVNQAMRRLEVQLSLNDDSLEQIGLFADETWNLYDEDCA